MQVKSARMVKIYGKEYVVVELDQASIKLGRSRGNRMAILHQLSMGAGVRDLQQT